MDVTGLLQMIVLGVMVLGIIVFVHELGHFVAARLVGVRVSVFSLGFGPRVYGVRRGDTDYRLSLLPLGGYVKMAGDNIEEERSGRSDEFLSRRWYERAFIAVAGPLANLVMTVVCGILLYATGIEFPLQPNVVGRIADTSPIADLGFVQGERITAADGEPVTYWHDVRQAVVAARDAKRGLTLRVESDARTQDIVVPPARVSALDEALVPEIPAEVGELTVGYPAYQGGLREGDVIVSIDDTPIRDWWDLVDVVSARPGQEILVVYERDGQRFQRAMTPADEDGVGRVGIAPVTYETGVERFGLAEAIPRGTDYAMRMTGLFVSQLPKIFSRPQNIGDNLAGPIAIMQMSATQAQRSRTDLLRWLMLVSVALMVMNLLPIPVLDGGHIAIALVEGVSRRPLAPRVHVAIYRVGMVFLLALMTYAVANDGRKLVQRQRAEQQVDPVEAPSDASRAQPEDR